MKRIKTPFGKLSLPMQCAISAWFLSFFMLLAIYIIMGIWPFGDGTVLFCDATHQYLPFHSALQIKLTGGESLLYSFAGGFGFNFWSAAAYYLSSPFNIALALVPAEHVCDYMDFAILTKLSLSSALFAWYLSHHTENTGRIPVAAGLCYGLSAYTLGFGYNLMWLDSIFVFPLVIYGLEKLSRERKGAVYLLSLFYSIWGNYSIGFMICIFSLLYFVLLELSGERKSRRETFAGLARFAFLSLSAAGMATVLLLPTYFSLMETASTADNAAPTFRFYTTAAEIMKNHMMAKPPIKLSLVPSDLNVYCGVFAVPGAVLYLLDKRRAPIRRMLMGGLTLFLLISFDNSFLNYIWHGFHFQNGVPNRFSFIYIALLLMMSSGALANIKGIGKRKILLAFSVAIGFTAWMFVADYNTVGGSWEGIRSYVLSLVFLTAYMILCLLSEKSLCDAASEKKKRILSRKILPGVIVFEIVMNCIFSGVANGYVLREFYIDDMESYRNMIGQCGDDSFFRSENTRNYMRNAIMYSGGCSTTLFNSVMQDAVVDTYGKLGLYSRMNYVRYSGGTSILTDMFGIKYLASPESESATLYGMPMTASSGPLNLYKNEDALSIGYMVDDEILNWDASAYENPFEVQNDLIAKATGIVGLFTEEYEFAMQSETEHSIALERGKQTYAYFSDNVSKISVSTPEYNQQEEEKTNWIYPLFPSENDDRAYIKASFDREDTVSCQVWTCGQESYRSAVEALFRDQLDVRKMEGNVLEGRIDVSQAGVLMFTVPYDEGWSIRINGETKKPEKIGDTFIGIRLEEGEYEISMRYIPEGFIPGALISGLFLVISFVYVLSGKKRRSHSVALHSGEVQRS